MKGAPAFTTFPQTVQAEPVSRWLERAQSVEGKRLLQILQSQNIRSICSLFEEFRRPHVCKKIEVPCFDQGYWGTKTDQIDVTFQKVWSSIPQLLETAEMNHLLELLMEDSEFLELLQVLTNPDEITVQLLEQLELNELHEISRSAFLKMLPSLLIPGSSQQTKSSILEALKQIEI